MSLDLSDRLKLARISAVRNDIDTGGGVAKLQLFSAPKPAAGGPVATAVKLVEFDLTNPCGTILNHVLTLTGAGGGSPLVIADGNIFWARIVDRAGDYVLDATVTDNTGAGPILVDTLTVLAGGTVTLISATFQ